MSSSSIKIGIFAPDRERCGISDYVRQLNAEIAQLDGISIVNKVAPPDESTAHDASRALATQFRFAARQVSDAPVELVHVHHEYSLFGGIARRNDGA